MKKQLAIVHNTLGLVELKKKNISPPSSSSGGGGLFRTSPRRLNLAALSLNSDYLTAEENFRAVRSCSRRTSRRDRAWRRAARQQKIDKPNAVQLGEGSRPAGASYFNLGLLYQDCWRPEAALQKAQDYYRQFLGHTSNSTSARLARSRERIKDIDEIYVASKRRPRCRPNPRPCSEGRRAAEEMEEDEEEEAPRRPPPTRLAPPTRPAWR
jgi:hypothetical protein